MKKRRLFTLLIALIANSMPLHTAAQGKKGDWVVAVGYGILPSGILLDYIIPGGGSHGSVNKRSTGVLVVGCRYQAFKSFALGISYGYRDAEGYYFDSEPYYNKDFAYRCQHLTLDGTFSYPLHDNASMYCTIAGGMSVINGHEHNRSGSRDYQYRGLGLQLTPIGVRFGKRLSGFVEFGLGYKGLVNGGVSYVVRRKKVVEKNYTLPQSETNK